MYKLCNCMKMNVGIGSIELRQNIAVAGVMGKATTL